MNVTVVLFELPFCLFSHRIHDTNGKTDQDTKCRFLSVNQQENKVLVTSMALNKVFTVDLQNGDNAQFEYDKLEEPSGISIDPVKGTVFIAFRVSKSIEAFNHKLGHFGTFLEWKNKEPTGLYVQDDVLCVAHNHHGTMLKVPFHYEN